MKSFLALFMLSLNVLPSTAQPQTFDIITHTVPAGWKQASQTANRIEYTNKEGKNWAQIAIFKNTTSKGSIEADFENEWKTLAAEPYQIKELPVKTSPETFTGEWQKMSGTANWIYNGKNVAVTITTFTGHNACVSILFNSTVEKFSTAYTELLSSVQLFSGKETGEQVNQTPTTTENENSPAPVSTGFKYNSTNFDDGWTSTIKEDWVEVTKGNIKVLIHFPKEGTITPGDPDVTTRAAWNILAAPHYSSLSNFKTAYVEDYNRPYFAMANVTETKTGKQAFVVLFRRSGGWLEIVSPNSNAFTQEFGFNPETVRWGAVSDYSGGWVVTNSTGVTVNANPQVFDKLDNMIGRNKFAVAASDLDNTGEWTNRYSSNTYYVNYYTGASAGMSTFSSSKWFVFKAGYKYHWQLAMVNSYGATGTAAQATGDGSFKSLNNWQLYFTEMEGKPKTFDVYFSAIKNGRVLWMNDAHSPGSGIFQGFAK